MDGGQFRSTRPSGRVVNGAEPAPYRPPERPIATKQEPIDEAPITTTEAPKRVSPAAPHRGLKVRNERPRRHIFLIVILIVLLVIAPLVGWLVGKGSAAENTGAPGINNSEYQAVFFTNGQVYFGKLSSLNDQYLKLIDIYYLQTQSTSDTTSDNPQKTSGDSTNSNVQLIKLGSEIHGPEDEMVIARDQVLFYENLKTNSKVVESIQKYQQSH